MVSSLSTTMERRAGSENFAIRLLWLTVGWNVIEGIVAVSSGIVAGSVALVGFGLDSFIEVGAAVILLWRMQIGDGHPELERRELLSRRVVGASFLVLTAYIMAESAYVVATGNEPESSGVGIALALLSLMVMPTIGLMKRRNAKRLGSPALIAESTETLVCSYLSFTLLIGLGANALLGWWWADLAAAGAMVPWIVKEGIEGLRGEACEDSCA